MPQRQLRTCPVAQRKVDGLEREASDIDPVLLALLLVIDHTIARLINGDAPYRGAQIAW